MINNDFVKKIFADAINKFGLEGTITNSIIIIGIIMIYTYVIYNFINA